MEFLEKVLVDFVKMYGGEPVYYSVDRQEEIDVEAFKKVFRQ